MNDHHSRDELPGRLTAETLLDRRTFVAGASAAGVAGLAGCIGGDDDANGDDPDGIDLVESLQTAPQEEPSYARWLHSDDEFVVAGMNTERAEGLETFDEDFADEELEDFEDMESMAQGMPISGIFLPLFFLAFAGFQYPFLDEVVFADDEQEPILGDEAETVPEPIATIETLSMSNEFIVLGGSVELSALEAHESVTEYDPHGEFTLYEVTSDDLFGLDDDDWDDDWEDDWEDDWDDDWDDDEWVGEDEDDEWSGRFEDTDDEWDDDGWNGDDWDTEQEPALVVASEDVILLPAFDREEEPEDFDEEVEVVTNLLDDIEAGGSSNPDWEWLFQQCGDGAFYFGMGGEELDEDEEEFTDPPGEGEDEDDDEDEFFELDDEDEKRLEELFEEHFPTGLLFVLDSYDDEQYVTRSGITFENEVPEPAELGRILTRGSDERNLLVEDNRFVVEAFWEPQIPEE